MRILIFSSCYPPDFIGGAELVAHRQACRFVDLGHEVFVFCGEHFADVPRHHVWTETFDGIRVTRIRVTPEDTQIAYANHANPVVDNKFEKALNFIRPEIVHFHNAIGLSVTPLFECRQRSIPTVATLHDHWGFCLRNTLITTNGQDCTDITQCSRCQATFTDHLGQVRAISERTSYVRKALYTVSRFIFPSAYLAQSYSAAGFPSERFEVLSYGLDPTRMPTVSKPSNPVTFSCLCYLGEHKGIHVVLEAFAKLPSHLDWRLNIAGFGHLEDRLKHFCRSEGLCERVLFLGKVSNEAVPKLLAETDVVILASLWPENEPVSILESFAHGVPVIATAVGGIPEMVQHGVNGWLVPPGNSQLLESAIEEAILEPEKRLRMASAATITGTRWPELRQIHRILQVYRDAILSEPPRIQPNLTSKQ